MAAGTPVLSTLIPGNRHLIRSGENGVLVPPAGEPKLAAMQREIPRLLADPAERRRLAEAAGREVRAKFRLQRMVDDYAAYYAALAD